MLCAPVHLSHLIFFPTVLYLIKMKFTCSKDVLPGRVINIAGCFMWLMHYSESEFCTAFYIWYRCFYWIELKVEENECQYENYPSSPITRSLPQPPFLLLSFLFILCWLVVVGQCSLMHVANKNVWSFSASKSVYCVLFITKVTGQTSHDVIVSTHCFACSLHRLW